MDCVDILKGIFKVGPCGIDGGEPFSMDNIDNITRISKIGVYYSTHIQAIKICVMFFGVEVCVEWGEKGGDSQEVPPFCISILIDFNFLSEKCEVLSLGNAN